MIAFGIAPQQAAAQQEHELVGGRAGGAAQRASQVLAQIADVAGRRGGAVVAPEVPEVRAALIGREPAPQQLARHLDVEADHVGLDERAIGPAARGRCRAGPCRAGSSSSCDFSFSASYIGCGNDGAIITRLGAHRRHARRGRRQHVVACRDRRADEIRQRHARMHLLAHDVHRLPHRDVAG